MSLIPELFFRDTKAGADPNAVKGSDNLKGLTDETAKQTYPHLLDLINSAEAGAVFSLAYGCAFTQSVKTRINNPNAVTAIVSLTFDGTHCVCEMIRPSNITVDQITTIKGVLDEGYNGLVTCAEVVDAFTFKYLPVGTIPTVTPAGRMANFDKMRCDAGAIKVRPYVSTVFTSNAQAAPICEYSDGSNAQHWFDKYSIQGIQFEGIEYKYTGTKAQGAPACFFVSGLDKESIYLIDLKISGYAIAINPNRKIGIITDLVVNNCDIRNNWSQGFLGGAEFSIVEDTVFDDNGHDITGGSNRQHNMYLSDCTHMTVRNCDLTRSAMKDGKAVGTELVVHGVCSNLIIECCYIHNKIGESAGGNYGIGVNSGYDTTEGFTGTIIRDNKIENCGNKSISCNAWNGGLIENNEIISDQPAYKHTGIMFDQERNTPGTPTSNGVSILNNIISGSAIKKDIDIQVGTNFTIVRPGDTPPTEPPPIDPPIEPPVDPVCNTEVLTTVQIKVNGVVTKTNEYLTIG